MAKILGSIEFDPINDDDSGFNSNNKFWHVSTLIRAAENQDCKKFKHYLCSCYFPDYSKSLNPLQMAIDFKRTRDADLNSPIILCPWGEIVDGTHRVTKALVENREWVWAYRLKTMPEADKELLDE